MASIKEQLENIYGPVGEDTENENVINQNGARHEIATIAAYLIGVPDKFLEERKDLFETKKIKLLSLEKRARAVREFVQETTEPIRI